MFSSVVSESDVSLSKNIDIDVNMSSNICLENKCDKSLRKFSFLDKMVRKYLHFTFQSILFIKILILWHYFFKSDVLTRTNFDLCCKSEKGSEELLVLKFVMKTKTI